MVREVGPEKRNFVGRDWRAVEGTNYVVATDKDVLEFLTAVRRNASTDCILVPFVARHFAVPALRLKGGATCSRIGGRNKKTSTGAERRTA